MIDKTDLRIEFQGDDVRLFKGRPAGSEHKVAYEEKTVYDFLDRLGVDFSTLVHPAAASMEECEEIRNKIGVPVFKNLFLTNKQQSQFFLLMIPAYKPFKTKYLSSQIGCSRLSFATPQHMEEFLHIKPGAVSPMGLIHDSSQNVRLIVDKDLADTEVYACHPCVNTASIILSLNDLLYKVLPATGHDFTWVDLPGL